MFNFFKKNNNKNVGFKHWDYETGSGFTLINNGDSLQYVHSDNSRIIYLSVLIVSGSPLLNSKLFTDELKLTQTAVGWELKGTRRTAHEMLVCVISFTKEDDEVWARDFFNSVRAKA